MEINYPKMYKIAKWVVYGLMIAFVAVFIILCIAVASKNKTIKNLKQHQTDQTELVLQANARADSLAKLDCITVNTTFIINTKNILSVNTTQANNISRTYATWTRDEVLHAIDSLRRAEQ